MCACIHTCMHVLVLWPLTLHTHNTCPNSNAEYIAQALRDVLSDHMSDLLKALNDLARCVHTYMYIVYMKTAPVFRFPREMTRPPPPKATPRSS